jgi:hypothetical protein
MRWEIGVWRLRFASPPVIHDVVPAGLGIENSTEILQKISKSKNSIELGIALP